MRFLIAIVASALLAGCGPGAEVKSGRELYLAEAFESREKLLQELGKHRTGKVCVYIKRLSDIDVGVLEKLVKASVAEMRKRYPS